MATEKLTREQSDRISVKVMVMFALAFVGILLLMLERRLLTHGNTFMIGLYAIRIIGILGLIGCVVGIIWAVKDHQKGKKSADSVFTGLNFFGLSLTLAVTAAGILFYDFLVTFKLLYILYPVLAVLYLIFHTYQRELFTIAVICATAAPILWMQTRMIDTDPRRNIVFIGGIVAIVIETVLLILAYRNKGILGTDKIGIRLLSKGEKPLPVCIMLALSVVALILGRVMGMGIAFWSLIALLVYLFICAVYYTVQML